MIDTSSWAQALRRSGDPTVRARVETLLESGTASWCEIIRLELWAGVGNAYERDTLKQLDQTLPRAPITDEIWDQSTELAATARARGFRFPATDILIYSRATRYGMRVEHSDRHFELLEQLGV